MSCGLLVQAAKTVQDNNDALLQKVQGIAVAGIVLAVILSVGGVCVVATGQVLPWEQHPMSDTWSLSVDRIVWGRERFASTTRHVESAAVLSPE